MTGYKTIWDRLPEADEVRGHDFLPSDAALATIPPLYATEGIRLNDKTLHLHFFVGGSDWYVAEYDPDTGQAFGWAQLQHGGGEWGYFSLPQLAALVVPQRYGVLVVERDLHFTPNTAEDVLDRFNY